MATGVLDAPAGSRDVAVARLTVPALLALAAAGWWWSSRAGMGPGDAGMAGMDGLAATGFVAFATAWTAMMAAMMLPAITPVVRLYGLAVARGQAAPVAYFVLGYLAVWSALAAPAYLAWRALMTPLAEASPWVARAAGATFLLAAAWQLTPLKASCLRHCRSPLGLFLRFGGRIAPRRGAVRLGAVHGTVCLGCCWPLFAVLVVLGTMNLAWMVALTVVVVLEKNAPHGEAISRATGALLAALGGALLLDTSILVHLI